MSSWWVVGSGGRASARPPFWLVVTRIVRRVVGEGWVYVLRKAEVGTGVDGWGSPFRSRQMGGGAGEERGVVERWVVNYCVAVEGQLPIVGETDG